MNLLVSSCCAFNSLDSWLAAEPMQDEIIEAALKTRHKCHEKYLDDVREFDIEKYWKTNGHANEGDSDDSDVPDEV